MPTLVRNYEYVKEHPYIDAIAIQYAGDLVRRFTQLKSLIWQSIVKNDCFRLRSGHIVAMAESLHAPFEFTENPEKVAMFMKWLNDAEDEGILEVTKREGRQVVAHSEWQNTYVRRSYEKGIAFAERKLAEAGVSVAVEDIRDVFNRPIHADALGMLYTRNFTELQGITEVMDQQISRVLTDGLSQGKNPRDIARAINNRVDNIGIARARTLARTEVNRAQNEATLNRYSDYGVKKVEWVATSARPCPICAVNDGSIHTREEAKGLLPAHPNCRCTWSPVVKETSTADELEKERKWALDHDIADTVQYGNLSPEAARALNRTIYAVERKYPELRRHIEFVGSMQGRQKLYHIPGRIEKGVRAQAFPKNVRHPGIALNETHFSSKAIEATKKDLMREVQTGWTAKGSGNLEGVVNHEIGHLLDGITQFRTKHGKALYGAFGKKGVANGLSRYAASDAGEMVAEGWAEYMGTEKPRLLARRIGRMIERELGVKFK